MKKLAIASLALFSIVGWSTALLEASVMDNPGQSGQSVAMQHAEKAVASSGWGDRVVAESIGSAHPLPQVVQQAVSAPSQVLGVTAYRVDQLNQQEAIDLVKPGVFSVITHEEGKLTVPDFDIDLKTLALLPRSDLGTHTTPINLDIYGSGFAVSQDGYVVTNAHVISKEDAYDDMRKDIAQHWVGIYEQEVGALSKADYEAYNQYIQQKYGTGDAAVSKMRDDLKAVFNDYLKKNIDDQVTQNIVLIDPSLKTTGLPKDQELDEAYKQGIQAHIVDFDKNFRDDGKDFALIRVDQAGLPALPLGNSDVVQSGAKVMVFGYPTNAQIDNADLFEPTISQGIISAVKQYKGQTVFQLDNKTSEGSSGGPLTDEHGNVIGVITYKTGDADTGDDFTFAIPINLIKDLLAKQDVANDLGPYGTNFLLGLAYQDQSSCKKAIEYFTAAEAANSHVPLQDQMQGHIAQCQSLIASGLSKDSFSDVLRLYIKSNPVNFSVFVALGFMLVTLLVLLAIHFVRRKHQQQAFTAQVSNLPVVVPPPMPPAAHV